MKKVLAWLILLATLMTAAGGAAAPSEEEYIQNSRQQLNVGNPTPLRGCFFTSMWGGNTSDMDVQELLHGYSPIIWDRELVRYRYDKSVVQNAVALDDEKGNRTYILVFYDDLQFSDGTPITAYDYAFSFLLQMDKAVTETGGKAGDYSWLVGSEEYLSGKAKTLSGVRVITDQMMQVQVKAEALPYFYELSRLDIHPYPIEEIAPGLVVFDEGEGVYLSEPLTAEMLKKTVLDPETGYLSHPKTVSGAYTLDSFDGKTALLRLNRKYKGDEDGYKPEILKLRYTLTNNEDMIQRLKDNEFGLLNKVTLADSIKRGMNLLKSSSKYDVTQYDRTGLTLIRFKENSVKSQDLAVRKAIALCFDRDRFIRKYAESFAIRMDAFCGIGQWMYRLATGQMDVPEWLNEAKVSLSGLTRYECNVEEAKKWLDQAGWTLNEKGEPYEEGVRYKEINGELVGLNLTMGLPESQEAREALETYLLANLEEAGIHIVLQPVNMALVQQNYEEEHTLDLLYLGENFTIFFDPKLLAPAESGSVGGNLTETREKVYAMALEMVRTEPTDVVSFMKKWVELQEEISETLPVLPVYSNSYFDFYTRELHNYGIMEAITWGEAIIESYMSDIEEPDEGTRQNLTDEVIETVEPLLEEQDEEIH